jgi:hypothetical protein
MGSKGKREHEEHKDLIGKKGEQGNLLLGLKKENVDHYS